MSSGKPEIKLHNGLERGGVNNTENYGVWVELNEGGGYYWSDTLMVRIGTIQATKVHDLRSYRYWTESQNEFM